MAKKAKTTSAQLRRGEVIGGLIYLPFYVMLTPMLISLIGEGLRMNLSVYQLNVITFVVNFIAIVLIFHRFLFDSLCVAGHQFWQFVQTVILAIAFYYAMYYALSLIYSLTGVNLQNANNDAVTLMMRNHRVPMLICTCALAPVVEESLCRGLIFGTLRGKNRIVAYAVSMLAFAILHVWQYVGVYTVWNLLLVSVTYLPAGLALAWAYEKSNTVWASILTHASINFITAALLFV